VVFFIKKARTGEKTPVRALKNQQVPIHNKKLRNVLENISEL